MGADTLDRRTSRRSCNEIARLGMAEPLLQCTVRLDRKGRVAALVPVMRPVPGLVPEKIIGRHYLDFIHNEEQNRARQVVAHLLGGAYAVELVLRANRGSGKSAWIGVLRATPWYEKERLAGVQGIVRLISGSGGRKPAPGHEAQQARLRHWFFAEAGLEQCGMPADMRITCRQLVQVERLSAIGALAASIAHGFSSPLCGIRAVIEQTVRKAGETDDNSLLRMALENCDQMGRLIRNVQQFNLPSSDARTPFDLHHAINSVLIVLGHYLKIRNTAVLREFRDNLPVLCGCESQIKQVLLRLIKSRADAMPERGGSIWIRTDSAGDTIKVVLSDTSNGIRQDDAPHLFPSFCSGPTAAGENGFGLSVSHGIIKAHGGEIVAESSAEQGMTITVILPAGRESKQISERQGCRTNHPF